MTNPAAIEGNLVELMLEFFRTDNAIISYKALSSNNNDREYVRFGRRGNEQIPMVFKTVADFIQANAIEPVEDTLHYEVMCNRLVREGLLFLMGYRNLGMFYLGQYVSHDYKIDIAEYGGYTMFMKGFKFIRDYFAESVVPIEIIYKNPKEFIGGQGTAFYIGKGRFVTAKHVIRDSRLFKLKVKGDVHRVNRIILDNNANFDFAILEVSPSDVEGLPFLRLAEGQVLEEIIAMGYPRINNVKGDPLITSSGQIVGTSEVSNRSSMHIVNCKIKGGHSGGPIVNRFGQAVGIITNDELSDNQEASFGLTIPVNKLTSLLKSRDRVERNVQKEDEWNKVDIGIY
ncbi:trypsin-like peptidase domain-containing protein [Deinococcus sp. KSM4-11]|uniref:S1 family peptidase n=1 Tax=Deinococcus sp. KSM4-11 TaxID=2568654 RepID=UPI0010A35367|nr:serine protease [Deinococcus sp. KSM4-11]THF88453.1 trypsin-like peptidase domain-containing protein [Deinococcus sp. KSM4-11]